jgi:hypothetical protein
MLLLVLARSVTAVFAALMLLTPTEFLTKHQRNLMIASL